MCWLLSMVLNLLLILTLVFKFLYSCVVAVIMEVLVYAFQLIAQFYCVVMTLRLHFRYIQRVNINIFTPNWSLLALFVRDQSKHINLCLLMEKYGSKLLGTSYKDPITSASHFQNFSVQHPEVYYAFCAIIC